MSELEPRLQESSAGREPDPARERRALKIARKGARLADRGEHRGAIRYYIRASRIDPENALILKLLAEALEKTGHLHFALSVYQKALAEDPEDPEIVLNLGMIAHGVGRLELAERLNEILIELSPEELTGVNNLATVWRDMGKLDEAIQILRPALLDHPHKCALWNTLGTVVAAGGDVDEAAVFFEEATRLDPEYGRAYYNHANYLVDHGRYAEAIALLDRALVNLPDNPEPHFARAHALIGVGDLEAGWKEYEWRLHPARRDAVTHLHGLPVWSGEKLAGKRVFVAPEQGVGDEIWLSHCIPDLLEEAGEVYIGCDWRLVSLFERSYPRAHVGRYVDIMHDGRRHRRYPMLDASPPADLALMVGSLPGIYRRTIADFEGKAGHIKPDPERREMWRGRLASLGPRPKVGVAWRSGVRTAKRAANYAPVETWLPLFSVEGVEFVNLQYDDCAAELAEVEARTGRHVNVWDDLDLRNDFEGTAALISELDLVVTAQISVSALSAAIGQKTWVLCFRQPWFNFGEASDPWCPARRFFDCGDARLHDWSHAFAEVTEALRRFAETS